MLVQGTPRPRIPGLCTGGGPHGNGNSIYNKQKLWVLIAFFIIYWVSVSAWCSASAKSGNSGPRRPLDQHFVSIALCICSVLQPLRAAKVDFDWQVTRMVHFRIFEPSLGARISKHRWRLNLLASDKFGIKPVCMFLRFSLLCCTLPLVAEMFFHWPASHLTTSERQKSGYDCVWKCYERTFNVWAACFFISPHRIWLRRGLKQVFLVCDQ